MSNMVLSEGLGLELSVIRARSGERGMAEKLMSEDGDEYDEWNVRDQGDTCHDTTAEPPRPRIYR